MKIDCIKCKGSSPMQSCGRTFCPIIAKSQALFKIKEKAVKEDFFSSSQMPFVGHHFYPHLYVGILSPPEQREDAWLYDAPNYWAEHNFQIPQIVDYRSALINSRFRLYIKEKSKFLDISQEIGMASKPVDIEVNLENKPRFRLNTDAYTAPTGPNARLKKIGVTSNPKIHHKVDNVVSDNHLKANDAIVYLYENEFDENFLTRLLSIGNLGLKRNRKLVPTRWSTTAVHDMVAKDLLNKIRDYPLFDYKAYFGSYLGNYYLLLFFPEIWSYELFETYLPKASWNVSKDIQFTTDYEPYEGRKTYAENCTGGWYSVRMAIAEHLHKIKRQGSCLAIRVITGEYAIPLGVWVTTEATRKALKNKPIEFSSKELMFKYAKLLIKKKFNYDLDNLLKKSIILKNLKHQTKLKMYV